ncbi:MAG TPA: ABC transporter permease, partial [Steroidobacteraceae bacterium]|nr:ABC transporter permease [Steroidobacteraceae bacterium]
MLLLLLAVGTAALGMAGFLAHAPNRLVSGVPVPLWHGSGAALSGAGAIALFLLAASIRPATRPLLFAVIVAAGGLLLLLLWDAGREAAALALTSPRAARTTLGPGFWIASLCAVLAIVDALQRLSAGPALRLAVAVAVSVLVLALAASGALDALSIAREYAVRRAAFAHELLRHCELVVGALVPALAVGMPLGIVAARSSEARGPIFALLNFVQTIPSIALFGLLIVPLAAVGLSGVGPVPAIIAITLYSLLPVVRNTEAGIRGVEPAVVEAASGMGMTQRQVFWRVVVPLG